MSFFTLAFILSSTGRRTVAGCVHRKCGRQFGGVSGYDRHLIWLAGPPWIECADPLAVGLKADDRGVWIQTYAGPKNAPEAHGSSREGHRG